MDGKPPEGDQGVADSAMAHQQRYPNLAVLYRIPEAW